MTSKPTNGLVQISGSVDPAVREILRAAGNGSISAGLRLALEVPTRTASGAAWIAHPALLPDPAEADSPAVLATPVGVIAHGVGPAGLVVDMEAGQAVFAGVGAELAVDLPLSGLATIAGRLLPAVLACCAADQRAHATGTAIGAGLVVGRLSHGLIEIAAKGQADAAIVLPLRQALQLAAELAALLARRVAEHQETVAELNAAVARAEAAA